MIWILLSLAAGMFIAGWLLIVWAHKQATKDEQARKARENEDYENALNSRG